MQGLLVSRAQVDAINAALPSDTRVAAVTGADGKQYLGADLLTDCAAGSTYEAAGQLLGVLTRSDFDPAPQKSSI